MFKVYFHIATLGDYARIVAEIAEAMKKSGLADAAEEVVLGIVGDGNVVAGLPRHSICRLGKANQFEFPTLGMLQRDAIANPDKQFLYVHTKGASTKPNPAIDDWRAYMTYFCIEKYKDALEALKNADCAGCDWRTDPTNHFSGNFWWANGKYLASLPNIEALGKPGAPAVLSIRHNAEFWIGMGDPAYHQLWDSGINQYNHHLVTCPRERYVNG